MRGEVRQRGGQRTGCRLMVFAKLAVEQVGGLGAESGDGGFHTFSRLRASVIGVFWSMSCAFAFLSFPNIRHPDREFGRKPHEYS